MSITFKHICDKDCEAKKIYEDTTKYYDLVMPTMAICATCIHNKKIDHFMPRENIEDTTTWQKIKESVMTHFIKCSRY
jgi:hypothetical protein